MLLRRPQTCSRARLPPRGKYPRRQSITDLPCCSPNWRASLPIIVAVLAHAVLTPTIRITKAFLPSILSGSSTFSPESRPSRLSTDHTAPRHLCCLRLAPSRQISDNLTRGFHPDISDEHRSSSLEQIIAIFSPRNRLINPEPRFLASCRLLQAQRNL